MKHAGNLESTKDAWVARGVAESNSSFLSFKLSAEFKHLETRTSFASLLDYQQQLWTFTDSVDCIK